MIIACAGHWSLKNPVEHNTERRYAQFVVGYQQAGKRDDCTARASFLRGIGIDNGTCSYGQPADGQFGNAGIGTERLPSFFSMDAAVGKKFSFSEGRYLEFRAEFNNLLNHVSWGQMGGAGAAQHSIRAEVLFLARRLKDSQSAFMWREEPEYIMSE